MKKTRLGRGGWAAKGCGPLKGGIRYYILMNKQLLRSCKSFSRTDNVINAIEGSFGLTFGKF